MSSSDSDVQAFRDVLSSAKSVIILAGAGLSAGSGISTYRGAQGLWKTQDPKKFATPEGFKASPSLVWQFYHHRREICLRAEPNAAHKAIAALSVPSIRSRVLPSLSNSDSPPLFITQNFDSLSLRALQSLADSGALSSDELDVAKERFIEMHGSAFKTACLQCKHVQFSYETPLSPALGTALPSEGSLAAAVSSGSDTVSSGLKDIPIEDLPRCGGPSWNGSNRYGRCGGLLRPKVVWFGEVPEGMGEISRALNWADVLIVVGTSSLVHPAAGFAKTVKDRGGKVAVFNLERSQGDEQADFVFLGPCEEVLPRVLGL